MQTVVTETSRHAPESMPDMERAQPPRQPKRPMTTTIGTVLSWVVAGLLLGAAGIHFGMMGEHAGVSWTHGVFFGVVAWLQLALAVAIVTRRSRPVVVAVIVCNLAVLGVWLLTRTVGIASRR